MAELLLKEKQFKELKIALDEANQETKFVFCFINVSKIEENFETIVSLVKSNNYKELFEKFSSKMCDDVSHKMLSLFGQADFPYEKVLSNCPNIVKLSNESYENLVYLIYKKVPYDEFKTLVASGKVPISREIANIVPKDLLLDFLSTSSYEGKRFVYYIWIEGWIEKFSGNNLEKFLGLCIEYGQVANLVRYCENVRHTGGSVDEERVKSIFNSVPQDKKIKFLLALYENSYNSSYNIFGYDQGDCSSDYYKDLRYIDIFYFIEKIDREKWLDLMLEKVSVLCDEPRMLFQQLDSDHLTKMIKGLPLDGLKKLIEFKEFEPKMKNEEIAKAVNDRLEEKKGYKLSSFFEQ